MYASNPVLGERFLLEVIDEIFVNQPDPDFSPLPTLRRSDKLKIASILGKPSLVSCFLNNVKHVEDPELPAPPYELVAEENTSAHFSWMNTSSVLVSADGYKTSTVIHFRSTSDGWRCLSWILLLSSLEPIEEIQLASVNSFYAKLQSRKSLLTLEAKRMVANDQNREIFKYSEVSHSQDRGAISQPLSEEGESKSQDPTNK